MDTGSHSNYFCTAQVYPLSVSFLHYTTPIAHFIPTKSMGDLVAYACMDVHMYTHVHMLPTHLLYCIAKSCILESSVCVYPNYLQLYSVYSHIVTCTHVHTCICTVYSVGVNWVIITGASYNSPLCTCMYM